MPVTKEQIVECARRLKDDPAFKEILTAMKASVFLDWGNNPNAEKREELYRDAQAIARLEVSIRAVADGAEIDARKAERANLRKGT